MSQEETEIIVGFVVIAIFGALTIAFPNTMLALLAGYLIGWKVRNDRNKESN